MKSTLSKVGKLHFKFENTLPTKIPFIFFQAKIELCFGVL